MRKINKAKIGELMTKLGEVFVKYKPEADYTADRFMTEHAAEVVAHYKFSDQDLADLVEARDAWEQQLTQQYGCRFFTGIEAFMTDAETELRHCGVPQSIRVGLGLLDCVIAQVYLKQAA